MDRNNPLVSVIVPIYQIERYIGICIESIINQTYKNLEIILVDDGSPDRCGEICDLYARKDPRIKVIHKKNGGLVSARKAGILAATGKYVGYVDGDDWIGPGFYESLASVMQVSDADVVAAGQVRDLFSKSAAFLNNLPLGIYEGERLRELQAKMISCGAFYRPGISTYVWNKLFRRDVLLEHQLNVDDRITIGEDAAVTYPVLMSCKRVYVTDCCAYHYRQREDSMLKQITPFSVERQKLRILYDYLSAFAATQPDCFGLQQQINDYVLSICIIRSGGMVEEQKFLPFEQDFTGKRVLVFSAGTFGQQLVNRLKEAACCNIVGWIDDDYWEYRRCCLDVDPVESIGEHQFDYVLIATVDSALAAAIRSRLQDYGISAKKILVVSCREEIRRMLLDHYFQSL